MGQLCQKRQLPLQPLLSGCLPIRKPRAKPGQKREEIPAPQPHSKTKQRLWGMEHFVKG